MADNSTPSSYSPLIEHLENAAEGAKIHGQAIGLVHNTEAKIRADLEALIGKPAGSNGVPPAVPGLKALWNAAQAEKINQAAKLRKTCTDARIYVRTCIRSLFPILGESWNPAWNAAGFIGGSLAVPTNPRPLLLQLRAYYANNPGNESTVQLVKCDAATCEAVAQSITDAENACNQQESDYGEAYANYHNGINAGRTRLTGLRTELEQLITDEDERWYVFGFDKPSDPSTPETPAHVNVVAGVSGSKIVIVDWDESRRSQSYRIRAVTKLNGYELANAIVQDNQTVLFVDQAAAGTLIEVTVAGRNATGESPASEPVQIIVP